MSEDKPAHGWTQHGHPVHAATVDYHKAGNWYSRINKKLAIAITVAVGSMNCAYLFAILAIAGLPTALKPGNIGFLFWISSDLLQLTLLSVIIVGQNLQTAAADARAEKTFEDTERTLDLLDCKTSGGLRDILDYLVDWRGIPVGDGPTSQARQAETEQPGNPGVPGLPEA